MDDTRRRDARTKQTPVVDEICLVLPLPPSINHQYATVNGRRVLSRRSRDYKHNVAEEVAQWLASQAQPEATESLFQAHYLSLTITFYFATALRRDLDGGLKIAQDALCEALGVNDNRVIEIHLLKRVDRYNPRSEMRLAALSTEPTNLYDEEGRRGLAPLPISPTAKRRSRRRHHRSLEELAQRYNWT
jgi:crossover junction endodeoxyribonuclease RusA